MISSILRLWKQIYWKIESRLNEFEFHLKITTLEWFCILQFKIWTDWENQFLRKCVCQILISCVAAKYARTMRKIWLCDLIFKSNSKIRIENKMLRLNYSMIFSVNGNKTHFLLTTNSTKKINLIKRDQKK